MMEGGGKEEDGLVLVSMGAMYKKDTWAKKYWSCSRGKDRHPYPVGYHALRIHAGYTYKMEIREDVKGPLFVITSIDKESIFGAGPTPDMAWEQFHKRSGPQVKLLHGKRCSGKVDGAEFFGFRNPLVQRLFRELVVNADGPAEQSLRSPNLSNGASGSKHKVQLSESRKHLDSLSLVGGRKTGKRSRSHKTSSMSTNKSYISSDKTDVGEDENQLHASAVTSFLKQSDMMEERENDSNILVSTGSCKLESPDGIAGCEEPCTASKQLEVAVAYDTPNLNSQNSDSDLIRQEMAKSMLSVLLPRVIPLLTKSDKRKRARSYSGEKPHRENNTTNQCMNGEFQDDMDILTRPTCEFITEEIIPKRTRGTDTSSVIPDSFEDDELTEDASIHQRQGNVTDSLKFLGDIAAIGDSSVNQIRNETTANVFHDEKAMMLFESLCEGISFDDDWGMPTCVDDKTYLQQNQLPSRPSVVHVTEVNSNDQANLDDCKVHVTDKKGHDMYDKVDKVHSQNLVTYSHPTSENCGGLFSESIICRNTGQDATCDTYSSVKVSHPIKNGQPVVADGELHRKFFLTNAGELDGANLNCMEGNPFSGKLGSEFQSNKKPDCLVECMNTATFAKGIEYSFLEETGSKNELVYSVELVGCCIHPAPILCLLLSSIQRCIHVCVICGCPERNERTLFLYEFPVPESRGKAPTFVGYTSITTTCPRGIYEREATFWNSILQLTPDGKHLVVTNSFRAPHCREKNINCLCFTCASDNSEENAIEVVHIELGYVSSLNKLATCGNIHCILVCEPNYLVAAEESGKLHVWLMNMAWSESVEGFSLPTSDWAGPMLELHTVPKSASLIVGHNGRGGFGLWDLSDRVLLTKYSTFHHSFVRILPIGLCSHTITDCLGTGFEIEKIKEIIASMDMSFCGSSAQYLHQTCREGIAVWLLILAYPEEYMDRDSGGSWRLALLVKNRVLIGKTLDPRASAANVSDGKGIIGTSDGLVYMWELSTGRKLFNLPCGRGGSILHIAADAGSGVLAVAGEDCKLCFYEQSIGR